MRELRCKIEKETIQFSWKNSECEDEVNRIINIKYDVPNNKLEMFDNYKQDIDRFYSSISEKHA